MSEPRFLYCLKDPVSKLYFTRLQCDDKYSEDDIELDHFSKAHIFFSIENLFDTYKRIDFIRKKLKNMSDLGYIAEVPLPDEKRFKSKKAKLSLIVAKFDKLELCILALSETQSIKEVCRVMDELNERRICNLLDGRFYDITKENRHQEKCYTKDRNVCEDFRASVLEIAKRLHEHNDSTFTHIICIENYTNLKSVLNELGIHRAYEAKYRGAVLLNTQDFNLLRLSYPNVFESYIEIKDLLAADKQVRQELNLSSK